MTFLLSLPALSFYRVVPRRGHGGLLTSRTPPTRQSLNGQEDQPDFVDRPRNDSVTEKVAGHGRRCSSRWFAVATITIRTRVEYSTAHEHETDHLDSRPLCWCAVLEELQDFRVVEAIAGDDEGVGEVQAGYCSDLIVRFAPPVQTLTVWP